MGATADALTLVHTCGPRSPAVGPEVRVNPRGPGWCAQVQAKAPREAVLLLGGEGPGQLDSLTIRRVCWAGRGEEKRHTHSLEFWVTKRDLNFYSRPFRGQSPGLDNGGSGRSRLDTPVRGSQGGQVSGTRADRGCAQTSTGCGKTEVGASGGGGTGGGCARSGAGRGVTWLWTARDLAPEKVPGLGRTWVWPKRGGSWARPGRKGRRGALP